MKPESVGAVGGESVWPGMTVTPGLMAPAALAVNVAAACVRMSSSDGAEGEVDGAPGTAQARAVVKNKRRANHKGAKGAKFFSFSFPSRSLRLRGAKAFLFIKHFPHAPPFVRTADHFAQQGRNGEHGHVVQRLARRNWNSVSRDDLFQIQRLQPFGGRVG